MGCLVRLLVALAVVLGLLVAGDFVARTMAENEVEQRLQDSQEISGKTDVEIHGFPFLSQLARKRFSEVEVSGGEVGDGRLQLSRFQADLRGVRPRSDGTSATVEAVDGSAFASFADLQEAVARPGVTVSSAGNDQIRVSGSVRLLGQSVAASATSKISVVDGDQLMVRATDIEVAGFPVTSEVTRIVGERLNFVVPVRGLPAGLRLVEVRVGQEGITAQVQGQNVLLQA